jgi:hypothetical protein
MSGPDNSLATWVYPEGLVADKPDGQPGRADRRMEHPPICVLVNAYLTTHPERQPAPRGAGQRAQRAQ